jgi:HD-GYP domain-containing protein (c-di-GMP phosphodiesterase class II)
MGRYRISSGSFRPCPLSERIVSLAEVYDALKSRRPYKNAWTHEEALLEIVMNKGKQFDPSITEAFVSNANKFKKRF